ncbi:uncharacterized protein TNCV_3173701 [Trichonephila clavipes]|nr:uncharacterized protein TNCV_3173701 [Trichonephila clavipes]
MTHGRCRFSASRKSTDLGRGRTRNLEKRKPAANATQSAFIISETYMLSDKYEINKCIPGTVFQQDNAHPHVVKTVSKLLFSPTHVNYSPDMSSIDHVLDVVGQAVARDPRPAASKDDTLLHIQAIWNYFPQADSQNLVRNGSCQCLRQVGLHYDRWRHHLSPPPQFRCGTGGEGNILQPPAPVVPATNAHKSFDPTDLMSTYFVCTRRLFEDIGHRTQTFRSGVRCSYH